MYVSKNKTFKIQSRRKIQKLYVVLADTVPTLHASLLNNLTLKPKILTFPYHTDHHFQRALCSVVSDNPLMFLSTKRCLCFIWITWPEPKLIWKAVGKNDTPFRVSRSPLGITSYIANTRNSLFQRLWYFIGIYETQFQSTEFFTSRRKWKKNSKI